MGRMFGDLFREQLGLGRGSGYKHGTPYVPQTKKYLLHKGEMVIPKKEATVLRRKMAEKKKKAPVKKAPVKKTKDKK